MSLFTIRPGIESGSPADTIQNLESLPEEANIHALCAAIAADYVKFVKKHVLEDLDMPQKYTIRDLQVLISIFESDTVLTSAHIVKISGLDPATVARSVKTLKDHGHIITESSLEDSRSRLLKITLDGRALAKEYVKASRSAFNKNGLSSTNQADEIGTVFQLLKDFRNQSRKLRKV